MRQRSAGPAAGDQEGQEELQHLVRRLHCHRGGGESQTTEYVQRLAVAMTQLGRRKSVTVRGCHAIIRWTHYKAIKLSV